MNVGIGLTIFPYLNAKRLFINNKITQNIKKELHRKFEKNWIWL
jgi:hypothetical protein